jgi:hypothetical protein
VQSVLIASPVRQKLAILAEFLKALRELDLDNAEVEFAFVDDNDDPASSALLGAFDPGRPVRFLDSAGRAESYDTDERTHHWLPSLMNRVAAYKDRFLKIALDEGFDAVLLVDSDLVLHPRTLRQLLDNDVPICSEIFWTQWEPGGPVLPQVWDHGQYELFHIDRGEVLSRDEVNTRTRSFLDRLREPGLHPVGGLGALTLIRREAIARGVSFRELPNVLVIGEDRDFCIRAAALDLPLFVDTRWPALHLYRQSDLVRVPAFKAGQDRLSLGEWRKASGNRIVLSMVVRNEANRHLERVLRHAASYVDAAVIIDDASTDDTVAVCERVLAGLPHSIVRLDHSLFSREHELRQLQWRRTLEAQPDWILALDADEIFEDSIRDHIRALVDQTEVDAIQFRLYDMWNERQYREDAFWRAHEGYWTLLVRPVPGMAEEWPAQNQHAGRFPASAASLRAWTCRIRVKHLGWMRPEDRIDKAARYRDLDSEGTFGHQAQYDSILDEHPNLVDWTD